MLGVRMIPASVPTATRATHLLVAALVLAACGDTREPVAPPTEAVSARAPHAPQQVAAWFRLASPEVLALPRTVLAHHDEHTNRLVVGVEDTGTVPAVERALQRLGIPGDAYAIEVTEPFHYLNSTLRSEHRPTLGGIQVEWSQRICTLGFNVDHAGGRSFITNSHCTDNKGQTGNTQYYQPDHGVNATPIGIEADDPPYFRRGDCPQGRRCRYSDAARVLYVEGVGSLGRIAKTDGPGTGSLEVVGSLDITRQDESTSSFERGTPLHKIGRTTGWTTGTTSSTCVDLNVADANHTLLCQTIVTANQQIGAGGDSGSPVFRLTVDDEVELVGILWGSTSGGTALAFSPLKNIQDELGPLDATLGGGGGDDPPPPDPENGTIVGTVTDAATGGGIENAAVSVAGTGRSTTTGTDGSYSIADVPVGERSVTASAAGFESETLTVTVTDGETVTADFALVAEGPGSPDPSPVIERFDVSTRTTGQWKRADVEWRVSHAGGALVSVSTELLEGESVVDSRTSQISGSLASGEHGLRTRSGGSAFTVRLTVRDVLGNEASETRTVVY
jgi:hypothetical protein